MKMTRWAGLALSLAMLTTGLGAWGQTVKILAGQSTTDAGIEDLISKAVTAKYPSIKLDWEVVDWGTGFQPKMQQYLQSGLPDLMVGKAQDVTTYASKGVLADLTSKGYIGNVLDAAVGSGAYKGHIYGVVFNALYQGVYYNRKIFKDNGLTVPKTQADLAVIIKKLNDKKITPFETHFLDTWSIGNITNQFAINDVFNTTTDWGDQFRANQVSFSTSKAFQTAYQYNKLIFDNTWKNETFSLEQTKADARLVQGKAAMKVSGSWSIQNFFDVDPNFDFGIFPFPNQAGNAKLIYEPNITFMVSKASKVADAVDKVLEVITTNKELATAIYNQTKTAPMLKGVSPTFKNPSQADIDAYAAKNQIVDANLGNNQLTWGGFQEENAKDIASWLQGKMTFEAVLKASDSRRANSKP